MKKIKILGIFLLLLTAGILCANAAENDTSPLGMNFWFYEFWTPDIPFKNAIKKSGGWCLVDTNTWQKTWPAGLYDEDGYPTTLPAHCLWTITLYSGLQGHYPAGTYVCLFEGAGTIVFGGDAHNVQQTSSNRFTFNVTPTFPDGAITMTIQAMTTPIKNVRVMPIEFENNEADNPWRPEFLANISNFKVLRFMDWMRAGVNVPETDGTAQTSTANTITLGASSSPIDGYYNGMVILVDPNGNGSWPRRLINAYNGTTKVATLNEPWNLAPYTYHYYIYKYKQRDWSERPKSSNINQSAEGKGMAIEYMVDLCNQVNASPWFCIYTVASDDYVQQFATYVRDHLNPNLKVYIEYSNETWNYGYPGYHYSEAKSAEMGISPNAYHAYRATQIFKIWDDVFGESHLRSDRRGSRLVRILATQGANTSVGTTIMDFTGQTLRQGYLNPVDPGHKAADYADTLAITNYFGGIGEKDLLVKTVDELMDKVEMSVTGIAPVWTGSPLAELKGSNAVITANSNTIDLSADNPDFGNVEWWNQIQLVGRTDSTYGKDVYQMTGINHTTKKVTVSPTPTTSAQDVLWRIGSGARYLEQLDVENARQRGLDTVCYEAGSDFGACGTIYGYAPVIGYVKSAGVNSLGMSSWWSQEYDTDNSYNGSMISITGGLGSGQVRKITGYIASTHTLTIDQPWDVMPTATSKYRLQTYANYMSECVFNHPRMKDLYLKILNNWKNMGLDRNGKGTKIWNAYMYVGQIGSREGAGYFDTDPLAIPAWQGLIEFKQNNPRWWDESVGTVYGDVSGDSTVTAYDAALVAQASVNLITFTADQTKAADVDGTPGITAYDAALIAQKSIGLIDKFPAEG